jgi:hypothetical protein
MLRKPLIAVFAPKPIDQYVLNTLAGTGLPLDFSRRIRAGHDPMPLPQMLDERGQPPVVNGRPA